MASLICWASGLLEVKMDKDVPPDGGPVVLITGTAGKLRQLMTAHGVYIEKYQGWYVPGCQDVPIEERTGEAIQHDRMTLVIAFRDRLRRHQLKKKGLRHLRAAA